jgi:hypothetical protein
MASLHDIEAGLRAECDIDIVGLWEVCAAVDRIHVPLADRRSAVLALCDALLADGNVCCALFRDGAFYVWSEARQPALSRIAAGYDAAKGRPQPGDVVYFASHGYLHGLIEPRVIWPSGAPAS